MFNADTVAEKTPSATKVNFLSQDHCEWSDNGSKAEIMKRRENKWQRILYYWKDQVKQAIHLCHGELRIFILTYVLWYFGDWNWRRGRRRTRVEEERWRRERGRRSVWAEEALLPGETSSWQKLLWNSSKYISTLYVWPGHVKVETEGDRLTVRHFSLPLSLIQTESMQHIPPELFHHSSTCV